MAAPPPPAASRTATVADRIAETLADYGVLFAFGIPGNDVLELIRACEARGIRFVLAKSEPSAAFMADAVYHLTGTPAALIAALGPGIANAVSGIAGAASEEKAFTLTVPAGASGLKLPTSGGTGGADIYGELGRRRTKSSYDYRP